MRKKPLTGKRGFVGEIGVVKERIDPPKEGRVFIAGEWWKAIADKTIEEGEKVEVLEVDRLIIKVKKLNNGGNNGSKSR
jgi:membrane-bound serine protease (ClpP class)